MLLGKFRKSLYILQVPRGQRPHRGCRMPGERHRVCLGDDPHALYVLRAQGVFLLHHLIGIEVFPHLLLMMVELYGCRLIGSEVFPHSLLAFTLLGIWFFFIHYYESVPR